MRTLLLPLIVSVSAAVPVEAPIILAPDPDRLAEAGLLLDRFEAALATTRSATALLQRWCAEQHLAPDPKIVAVTVPGMPIVAAEAERARLDVGMRVAVAYRHVRLTCGGVTLSEAENFYVPARLTDEMNAALEGDAPFGAVIAPMKPVRETIESARMWSPPASADAPVRVPRELFRHSALVRDPSGMPLALVSETYTSGLIARLSVR